MTDAERKLWWHLREARIEGTHFRRQATIGRYFVDFCCHSRRLVIEIDGGGHAGSVRMIADSRRTVFLNSRGYRVLRFWNNDVLQNIEGVMTIIQNAVVDPANPGAPHP